MFNMRKKTQRIVAAIIVFILVFAMVATTLLAALP